MKGWAVVCLWDTISLSLTQLLWFEEIWGREEGEEKDKFLTFHGEVFILPLFKILTLSLVDVERWAEALCMVGSHMTVFRVPFEGLSKLLKWEIQLQEDLIHGRSYHPASCFWVCLVSSPHLVMEYGKITRTGFFP